MFSIEPSREIKLGRRAIDGLDGCQMLTSLSWLNDLKKWHIKLKITSTGSAFVPKDSEWDLLFDDSYPWGEIKFFPSATGSIEVTFPHQSFNYPPRKRMPWRLGNPCLDTDVASLNRSDVDSEPMTGDGRLLWHVRRLIRWLDLAATDLLLGKDDPFELPVFPLTTKVDSKVVFNEDSASFSFWKSEIGNSGVCRLFPYHLSDGRTPNENTFIVRSFSSESGQEKTLTWGREASRRYSEKRAIAAPWLILPKLPVALAWQVPQSWKELLEICKAHGLELENILYAYLDDLREQSLRLLLLGFPIPQKMGEPDCQLQWQAIKIPPLTPKDRFPNGFRNNRQGRHVRDVQDLSGIFKSSCEWVPSENWNKAEITTRGSFEQSIQSMKAAMIGCGALGSFVAEGLVRNGLENVVLTDGETLAVGNLVRHTLGLDDLGDFKTVQVADRLNKASPHSTAEIIEGGFPPKSEKNIAVMQSAEIVIDCTGSDKLLAELANFQWQKEKLFFSISLGLNGRRMFAYFARAQTFPFDEFRAALRPWLIHEKKKLGMQFPREGTGCWHSVFPARIDDVQLFTATAVKFIEECIHGGEASEFAVFEQIFEETRFMGIRRQRALD